MLFRQLKNGYYESINGLYIHRIIFYKIYKNTQFECLKHFHIHEKYDHKDMMKWKKTLMQPLTYWNSFSIKKNVDRTKRNTR